MSDMTASSVIFFVTRDISSISTTRLIPWLVLLLVLFTNAGATRVVGLKRTVTNNKMERMDDILWVFTKQRARASSASQSPSLEYRIPSYVCSNPSIFSKRYRLLI